MAEEKIRIIIEGDSKKLVAATAKVNKAIVGMGNKMKEVSRKMQATGKIMSLAISAPLILIGKKALTMAMQVEESENLFKVAFGNMADAAKKWSDDVADSLGLNRFELRKTSATFDTMLKSMGLSEQAAFDMSTSLTELGIDLASFRDLEFEEAFNKIQAGITGETEGLKRLGIIINETTIQQFAWNTGLVENGKKLTEQEKILARYGSLMEQTKDAQGDFARTQDGATNSLKAFKDQVNELLADLGTGLIPMFKRVLNILKPMVKRIGELSDNQKKWALNTALVLTVLGPLLFIVPKVVRGIVGLRNATIALNVATKAFLGTIGVVVALLAASYLGTQKLASLFDNQWAKSIIKSMSLVGSFTEATHSWNIATRIAEEENISLVRALFRVRTSIEEHEKTLDGSTISLDANSRSLGANQQMALNNLTVMKKYGGVLIEATKEVNNFGESIDNLPISKVINITTHYRTTGEAASAGVRRLLESPISTTFTVPTEFVPSKTPVIPATQTKKGAFVGGTFVGLQEGGIVKRMSEFLVGENGPERLKLPRGAVVEPLSAGGGGGDLTINFNGAVVREDDDFNRIADEVSKVIHNEQLREQRGGGFR